MVSELDGRRVNKADSPGWGLVKSASPELQTEGVKLLQEIYSASPSHRRECTFYIAVGYYKLRNYSHAKTFNGE